MHKKMTLNDLKIGERGVVTNVSSTNLALYSKLLSMGVVPGTTVAVSNVAPTNDPIEIRARGIALSIRREEAQSISVNRS